jgi:hypothetical protein
VNQMRICISVSLNLTLKRIVFTIRFG